MTYLPFQFGLSNACFALAVGVVAKFAGAKGKRPHLAYMLWLLVFVKLMTPPILTIPVDVSSTQLDHRLASESLATGASPPEVVETPWVSWRSSSIAAFVNRAKPAPRVDMRAQAQQASLPQKDPDPFWFAFAPFAESSRIGYNQTCSYCADSEMYDGAQIA